MLLTSIKGPPWCLGTIGSTILTYIGYTQTNKHSDKKSIYVDLKNMNKMGCSGMTNKHNEKSWTCLSLGTELKLENFWFFGMYSRIRRLFLDEFEGIFFEGPSKQRVIPRQVWGVNHPSKWKSYQGNPWNYWFIFGAQKA